MEVAHVEGVDALAETCGEIGHVAPFCHHRLGLVEQLGIGVPHAQLQLAVVPP